VIASALYIAYRETQLVRERRAAEKAAVAAMALVKPVP